MTQEEKIAQLFVDMLWNDTGKQTAALLGRYPSGGLRYNNRKPRELYRQNAAAQKNSRIPLLIAANVEAGGNGAMTGGTKIGEGIACAATGDIRSAYEMGLYGCREAAAVGCNWTFAPVVDIDRNWRKLCYSYALFRQRSRHCAGDGPRLHERGKRGGRRLLHEAFSR